MSQKVPKTVVMDSFKEPGLAVALQPVLAVLRSHEECSIPSHEGDGVELRHLSGPSFARWREETAGMVVKKIYGTRCAVLD
jgi:hypothetical protein